jgi:hypothetical protein
LVVAVVPREVVVEEVELDLKLMLRIVILHP